MGLRCVTIDSMGRPSKRIGRTRTNEKLLGAVSIVEAGKIDPFSSCVIYVLAGRSIKSVSLSLFCSSQTGNSPLCWLQFAGFRPLDSGVQLLPVIVCSPLGCVRLFACTLARERTNH